ncbi:hypothetical protein [Sphingomonas antarctica]|uniref:hypothetical protein n=1 Tax=Sphingomonas antarctica TaxID=2040274 RepID=UPI0039EC33D8
MALLAAVMASSATAQHPLILAKLKGWNDAAPAPPSAMLNAEVMKTAIAVQGRNGGCLPTSAVIDRLQPATAERYIFNGLIRGQIRNGWTEIVRHPNCGPEVTRYMTMQQTDGTLNTVRVNRGVSYAHDSLIGDTVPLASLAADQSLRKAGAGCEVSKPGTLGVIRIASEDPGLGPDIYGVRYAGGWSEIWPVSLCGRTVEVLVHFLADGDGGAYTDIKDEAAKLLPSVK